MHREFLARWAACLVFCGFLIGGGAHAARIEAEAGKRYTLTKQHGPWMIMVASFHATAPEPVDGRPAEHEGKTPEEAADELVFELRQKGIPAYFYSIKPQSETINTLDRLGRPDRMKNLRRVESIGVIAGNYEAFDSDPAQKTLAWIKKFRPKCLEDGVVFSRQEPLGGAFLTINPVLTPDEVAARRHDPLLRKLNSGVRNSLSENTGKLTLVVATFAGKSVTLAGNKDLDTLDFLKDNDLDAAGQNANDLAVAIRQHLNIEAYVWHDQFQSIVTVGAFASPSDPAIRTLHQRFAAKQEADAKGQPQFRVEVLVLDSKGRMIADPRNAARAGESLDTYRLWAFDPAPQIMRVPQLR